MMKHDVMLGGCGTDPFENYAASNWIIFPGVKMKEEHLKPTARMALIMVLHVAWQFFTDSF